jgi:integrase
VEKRTRDLAMFNLAIDSKLRGCDVVSLKVEDVAPHGITVDRATVRQRKIGHPVRFELSEQTREAVDDYIRSAPRRVGDPMHSRTFALFGLPSVSSRSRLEYPKSGRLRHHLL